MKEYKKYRKSSEKIVHLDSSVNALKKHIMYQEIKFRKCNLLVYGMPKQDNAKPFGGIRPGLIEKKYVNL